jgi:thiamine transport system permease protein
MAIDGLVLALALAFLAPPLASILAGFAAVASLLQADVLRAAVMSIAIAAAAAATAVGLAVALALPARDLRTRLRRPRAAGLYAGVAFAPLALPPFTLVAGLYVVLRGHVDATTMGVPMVVLVNALMALPFAMRLLEPPLALSQERYGRLADSLGIEGLGRLRLVDWPLLRGPLFGALATSAALSMGDLGVIAFFGGAELTTLPLLLYQRLGAYRMEEAAAVAMLLAGLVFALALIAQTGSDADARAA